MPARPPRERDGAPGGGVPFLQQPFACETFRLCPPPPAPPATVHLRSGRLPTPLIVVSASLLGVTALLLLALLVRWLIRRRRAMQDEAPLAREDDEESVDSTAGWGGEGEEVDGSGDVHHVWFIRTKGLDERAIAAIAAVVYDSSAKGKRCGGDGGCAVCLAEFRDGETLRLLPRCAHAFHRACIDTWLRAHVNCPLCRAPVQPLAAAKPTATPGGEAEEANDRGALAEEAGRSVAQERAVRRAASMVSLPRRAWPPPDASSPQAPASSSGREEEDVATGLAKVRRLLKFSDMAAVGAGRSFSFSFGARSCQGLPTTTRSGPSTAAGVSPVIQLLEGGVMMN